MQYPLAVLALLLALAAPAGALLHGQPTMEQPSEATSTASDPLVLPQLLFLTAEGSMVHEAPADGAVAAPMALPGQDSVAAWAHDAAADGAFAGTVQVRVPYRVALPAAAVPPRALFEVALLHGGEPLAAAESGPQSLMPGDGMLDITLDPGGAAFVAGDGLGLTITLRTLSLDPAPTVEYLVGPEGAQLDFAVRFASLDAVGHEHAAGDRHALAEDYRFRTGDLGAGLWGIDLSIARPGAVASLPVPADASRVLLQLHLAPGAEGPMGLDVPGGATTLYPGEVVAREVPAKPAPRIACTTCGAQPVTIAQVQAAPPGTNAQPGEALQPASQGLQAGEGRDALVEASFLLVLFLPAGVMLGAAVVYVIQQGGVWHSPEGSAPARPPARRSQPQRPSQRQGF